MNGWIQALSRRMEAGVLLVNQGGEVELVSDGAAALLNLTADEVRSVWPRLREQLDRQTVDDLWQAAESEVSVELDVGHDGSAGRRPFRVEVLRVEEDDCTGHLIVLRDGRRAEAAERDLALVSQMRSVGHLYRSVAHDLRAPLNAMVVNLELLADAVAQGPDEEANARSRRYAAVLKEEMERLQRYLENFLYQTAPPDEGRRRFDLAEHLRRMTRFIAPQAQHQKTELVVDLPGEPVEVEGNPDHLRQAVLSLLVNALEAVEARSEGRVELGLDTGGGAAGRIRLWVADNGPGIDAAARERIFHMHYTTKPAGSGIGLHVARRMVEQHGGTLRLASEPRSGGTRFEITLPRPAAAPHEES